MGCHYLKQKIGRSIGKASNGGSTKVYDLADRITRITYPSGRWVNYARDAQGRVSGVTTRASGATATTTLMSSMVYEPFGALTTATLGNSQRFAQLYDTTGRRTHRRYRANNNTTNIWSVAYGYDPDDNITGITDLVDASRSQSFGYDPVDRLTRVDLQTGAVRREDYAFDTNGNRMSVARRAAITDATPQSSDTYTRTPGTNRITSVTTPGGTRSFTHDARGNLSGETRPGSISVTTGYDNTAERRVKLLRQSYGVIDPLTESGIPLFKDDKGHAFLHALPDEERQIIVFSAPVPINIEHFFPTI
jgi:YD repeat-containing protein